LFNRGIVATRGRIELGKLKLDGAARVRDLWRQRDLGSVRGEFAAELPRHGCVLVRVWGS
jgi:alpha-galactosidase